MSRPLIAILAVAFALGALPACGDFASLRGGVERARYTPDGDVVVLLTHEVVTLDGQLLEEKGHVLLPPLPARAEIFQQEISADGQIVATAWLYPERGCGMTIDVVRVAEQRRILQIPCAGYFELSEGGQLLGTWEDVAPDRRALGIYDLASAARLWSSEEIQLGFNFSRDGARLYTSTIDGNLQSFDSRTGDLLLEKPLPKMDGADFPYVVRYVTDSPDGQRLLVPLIRAGQSVDDYGWFRSSDLEVEQIIPQAEGYDQVSGVHISPDGQRFASSAERPDPINGKYTNIQMWTSSGTLLYVLDTFSVTGLSFSPGGDAMVTPAWSNPGSPDLSLLRVSDGALIGSYSFTIDPL